MKKAALLTPVVVLASFALARAASAYASDAEVTAALSAFRADYASKEDSVREKAVKTLGNTKHKRIVEALAAPLTKDSSQLVRRAAAAEIGAQWTPNAVKVLASALQPDDVSLKDVNAAIIKALGATSSDEAVPVLVGLLAKKPPGRSKSPPVANDGEPPIFTTTALKALTQIASPRAMDDALLFLVSMGKRGGKGSDDEYGKATEDLLAAITGEHLKGTNEWNRWWLENKNTKKVIAVYRCEGTGMLFEKTDPKAKCTHDSDKNPGCGVFLKSKLEGCGEPKKEKRERKAKDSKKDDSKKDDSKKDDSKN